MDFHISNEALARIEADLPYLGGQRKQQAQIALCWHLRQRNSKRALQMLTPLRISLSQTELPEEYRQAMLLRLDLIEHEILYLRNEYEKVDAWCNANLPRFAQLNDILGQADVLHLQGMIAFMRANLKLSIELFLRILALPPVPQEQAAYWQGRLACSHYSICILYTFSDPPQARIHFTRNHLHDLRKQAIGRPMYKQLLGANALLHSDLRQIIHYCSQACKLAQAQGMIATSLLSMRDIAEAFSALHDYHSALQWIEKAVVICREQHWHGFLGMLLTREADILRHLQQLPRAWRDIEEALPLAARHPDSYVYSLALLRKGELAIELKEYKVAQTCLQELEQQARQRQADMLMRAQKRLTKVWLEIGAAEACLASAHAVLNAKAARAIDKITVLRLLARAHQRFNLPDPPDMRAPNAHLHYLQLARELVPAGNDYCLLPLLEEMAQAYATPGDFETAWHYSCEANAISEKIYLQSTTQRALAMQLHHEAEHELAEEMYQKELHANSRRAENLLESSELLRHLNEVGQEITAHLETDQVFLAVERSAQQFFEYDYFAIFELDQEQSCLHRRFVCRFGQIVVPADFDIALHHPSSHAAKCARTCTDVSFSWINPSHLDMPLAEAQDAALCSGMFAPLQSGDTITGVMCIQSRQTKNQLYGPREQLIFRALCTYTAIALANAQVHEQLQQTLQQLQLTQQQMALQEKMAGLGTLTAGVAHEINNPTNFTHVAAQNQLVALDHFENYVNALIDADNAREVVDDFAARFATLRNHLRIISNGTERIKNIVRDLRNFTRLDQADKQSIQMSTCMLSPLNLVRASWLERVEFLTDFQLDPKIECWPALLNQLFLNLLVNACEAIAEKQGKHKEPSAPRGKVWMRLHAQGEFLLAEVEDNGCGMDDTIQGRIMEAFFSTKTNHAGSGLGLAIVKNIADKHGAGISFRSSLGQGSCFTLSLPLAARSGGRNQAQKADGA